MSDKTPEALGDEDIELHQSSEPALDTEPRTHLSWTSWWLLVMLALMAPAFATALTSFERVREALLGMGGAVLLAGWGWHVLRRHPLTLVAGRVHALLLVFVLWAAASALWADNMLLGTLGAARWLALAAVALCIAAPIGRPLRFQEFAGAVAAGAGLSGLWGILDAAGIKLFTPVWDPPGATGSLDALAFAAAYYAVALPTVAAAAVRAGGKGRLGFLAAFALGATHFALASGWLWAAVFGGAAALAAFVVVGFQRAPSALALLPAWALTGGVALLVLGVQVALPAPPRFTDATNLPQITQLETTAPEVFAEANVRNALFATDRMEAMPDLEAHPYLLGLGLDLFGEQPVVGHGVRSWWDLQTRHVRPQDPFVQGMFAHYAAFKSPHNGYVLLAVELGAVGLGLFLLWVLAVAGVTVSSLTDRSERMAWLLDHWALISVFFAGLAFFAITPAMELSAPMLLWVASTAMLVRLSSAINSFRGWSAVWSLGEAPLGEETTSRGFSVGGLVPVAMGLAMIVPVTMNAAAAYYRGLGDHLMLRTYYERATAMYGQAHQWFPAYGEVPYNMGLAHNRLGKTTEAVDEVNAALTLRPFDARVLTLASLAHLRSDDARAATDTARQAVVRNPNDIEAYRVLASALAKQLREEEAATVLQDAIKRNPPRRELGNLHQRLGELYQTTLERPLLAAEHFEKAADNMAPSHARTLLIDKASEMRRRVERERLIREGKPVPKELMPPQDHGHEGHGH